MSINACADRTELTDTPFSLASPGARSVTLAIFLPSSTSRPTTVENSSQEIDEYPVTSDLLPLVQISPGLWHGAMPLRPGRYEYLFLVDGTWVLDPDAPEMCPDGCGGYNSIRTVAISPAAARPIAPAFAAEKRQSAARYLRAV